MNPERLWGLRSLCSRSYGCSTGIGLCNSNPGRTNVLEVLSCKNPSVSPWRSFIRVYLKRAGIDRTGLVDIGNNLDQIVCLRGCVHGGFNGVAPVSDIIFNSLPGSSR